MMKKQQRFFHKISDFKENSIDLEKIEILN